MVRRKDVCIGYQDKQAIQDLVKKAFSQRRKKLSTIFKSLDISASAFTDAGINPDSRPEEISPEHWMRLSTVMSCSR
jgi:16S rRNA A1518/A1519 N6-dimethyltransferase RsmA/KsgA/DIM1 with predicted DNA glycosylase/AP lyase activity